MYEIVLFDLDGTLTDPEEGITACVKYALESFGIHEENKDKLRLFIGPPLKDAFMKYYGFSEEDALSATEKYRERFSTVGLFENRLIDNMYSILETIKKSGFKIVLATSKPICFAKRILEHFDILDFFDECVGAELHGTLSAKKDIIAEAIRRLGEDKKERMIMVGDREMDILGAKANGIASLGVRFGYAVSGELENAGADFIADTPSDMLDIILNVGGCGK